MQHEAKRLITIVEAVAANHLAKYPVTRRIIAEAVADLEAAMYTPTEEPESTEAPEPFDEFTGPMS